MIADAEPDYDMHGDCAFRAQRQAAKTGFDLHEPIIDEWLWQKPTAYLNHPKVFVSKHLHAFVRELDYRRRYSQMPPFKRVPARFLEAEKWWDRCCAQVEHQLKERHGGNGTG